jgi:hypothetical protein
VRAVCAAKRTLDSPQSGGYAGGEEVVGKIGRKLIEIHSSVRASFTQSDTTSLLVHPLKHPLSQS